MLTPETVCSALQFTLRSSTQVQQFDVLSVTTACCASFSSSSSPSSSSLCDRMQATCSHLLLKGCVIVALVEWKQFGFILLAPFINFDFTNTTYSWQHTFPSIRRIFNGADIYLALPSFVEIFCSLVCISVYYLIQSKIIEIIWFSTEAAAKYVNMTVFTL